MGLVYKFFPYPHNTKAFCHVFCQIFENITLLMTSVNSLKFIFEDGVRRSHSIFSKWIASRPGNFYCAIYYFSTVFPAVYQISMSLFLGSLFYFTGYFFKFKFK